MLYSDFSKCCTLQASRLVLDMISIKDEMYLHNKRSNRRLSYHFPLSKYDYIPIWIYYHLIRFIRILIISIYNSSTDHLSVCSIYVVHIFCVCYISCLTCPSTPCGRWQHKHSLKLKQTYCMTKGLLYNQGYNILLPARRY